MVNFITNYFWRLVQVWETQSTNRGPNLDLSQNNKIQIPSAVREAGSWEGNETPLTFERRTTIFLSFLKMVFKLKSLLNLFVLHSIFELQFQMKTFF